MNNLSPIDLKDKLVNVTIGGTSDSVNLVEKAQVFTEYIQRAFPEVEVLNVIPTNTAAALNSVSGIIQLRFPDGEEKEVFGKIHIESNTKSISPLGAEKEYANAEKLADAGWPVLEPIAVSKTKEYPLLLYPVLKEPTLFDILEESYTTGIVQLTSQIIERLERYNETIGAKEVKSLRVGSSIEAMNAPVQALFLKRIEKGGRIDQWYTAETMFNLPGLDSPISWGELLDTKWVINGIIYSTSLRKIIDQARKNLTYQDEKETFLTLSHGDDHAGNIRLTDSPIVFDPAFAGWNPVSLGIKALAHTGFLPSAGMYYSPKGLSCVYKKDTNTISVEINIKDLPTIQIQEVLVKQIVNLRIIPILKALKEKNGNIEKEVQVIKNAMSCCALLTVNIAKLLEQSDGRAIGLLPITIMFNELKGLPMLEYVSKQVDELSKKENN